MSSLQQLAKEALDVQDASNASGVAFGYTRALVRLKECLLDRDSNSIQNHPISRLWACKLYDLAGMGIADLGRYGAAYEACQQLASGESRAENQPAPTT